MTTKIKEHPLQHILDEDGFSHIRVIDKDTVTCIVDGDREVFRRDDVYSGHPLSGWANYGPVGGDHRMIEAISSDMEYVFNLLNQ